MARSGRNKRRRHRYFERRVWAEQAYGEPLECAVLERAIAARVSAFQLGEGRLEVGQNGTTDSVEMVKNLREAPSAGRRRPVPLRFRQSRGGSFSLFTQ